MSLVLGDNFDFKSQKPLDARLKYSTVADMKAVGDATMYDGCMAYCSGTDKTYQWKSTNSVDATTGRWREFSAGSGGSYTAGDGIVIDDDEISIDPMPAEDVDEVIDVYPIAGSLVSIVNAFNKGDIYSTEEKMIGQWIDGKPLYAKSIILSNLTTNNAGNSITHGISNLDTVVAINGSVKRSDNSQWLPVPFVYSSTSSTVYFYDANATIFKIGIGQDFGTLFNYTNCGYATILYTKTTDTAISIGEATEYSTEEKIVGTWIDGKPIYQKTWITHTPTIANTVTPIVTGLTVETLISINGNVNNRFPLNWTNGSDIVFQTYLDSNRANIVQSITIQFLNIPCIVTIQYTKTTT